MAFIFFQRSIGLIPIIALAMFASGIVSAAESPRERLLMDFGWRFHLGDAPDAGNKFDYPEVSDLTKTHVDEIGLEGELATNLPDPVASNLGGDVSFVQPKFNDGRWRLLDLPHDWAVELPFDEKADMKHGFKPVGPGFPQNSIGWYRREFNLPASDKGKSLWLEFDGVYRNSLVWLNGHCLGRHLSGYSGFRYDISRFANCGGKNELVVRVDASRFEGWFYEGAGIYRHVWLEKTSPVAIAPDGIFVWSKFENNVPEGMAEIHIQTKLKNSQSNWDAVMVDHALFAPDGRLIDDIGVPLQSFIKFKGLIDPMSLSCILDAQSEESIEDKFILVPESTPKTNVQPRMSWSTPVLWSPESPKLYKLVTTVKNRTEQQFLTARKPSSASAPSRSTRPTDFC